jgi:hypothetical protein
LIPLFALWLADALVRPRLLRSAAVLFFALMYRFCYGLNLPELIATVAALFVVEASAPRLPRAVRVAGVLAALAMLVPARDVFDLMVTGIGMPGWIVAHDVATVWRGQMVCIAALVLGMAPLPPPEASSGSGIVRALRVPVLFGLASAGALQLMRRVPGGERAFGTEWADYYFQKHDLHAAVLVASALVVLAAFLAAEAVERKNRRTTAAVAGIVAVAAIGQWDVQRGVAPYRPIAAEIAFGAPPYPRLRPWVDPAALAEIEHTLAEHRAQLGGFVARYYPTAGFMNAMLGRGQPPLSTWQPIDTSPGHCVFWEAGTLPAGDADPTKLCRSHSVRWERDERVLCQRCF